VLEKPPVEIVDYLSFSILNGLVGRNIISGRVRLNHDDPARGVGCFLRLEAMGSAGRLESAFRIARVFGVGLEDVFGWEGE
jgi:hypothetical protein